MLRVNLLPPEHRPPSLPLARISTIFSSLLLLVCVTLFSYNLYTIGHMDSQIQVLQARNDELEPLEKEIAQTEGQRQEIAKRQGLVQQISQARIPWYHIISHLTAIAPPDLWFINFSSEDKEQSARKVIKITGVAKNYLDLTLFINKMENDSMFVNPSLAIAEENTNKLQSSKRFEITVQIRELK